MLNCFFYFMKIDYNRKYRIETIRKKVEKGELTSWKLRRYFKLDLKCQRCQTEAKYFKYNKRSKKEIHLNLFSKDGKILTIDHIIPTSLGGKNQLSNQQILCSDCNHLKADLLEDENGNLIQKKQIKEKILITEDMVKFFNGKSLKHILENFKDLKKDRKSIIQFQVDNKYNNKILSFINLRKENKQEYIERNYHLLIDNENFDLNFKEKLFDES